MKTKRVILLDDHTLFLRGLALILKEENPNYDIHPYQSIAKMKSDKLNFSDFDLLISDIELPNEDSFALFTSLKKANPEFHILIVSMHKKNVITRKCKSLGIDGYLLKDDYEHLNKAVNKILNGGSYYSETIIDFYNKTKDEYPKLTYREEEVITLMAQGLNNSKIAQQLSLSVETVKTHKKNIRSKLELDSNFAIIEYAKQNFLL